MKRKIRIICAGFIFLAGFLIFSWSDMYRIKTDYENRKVIENYQNTYNNMDGKGKKTAEDTYSEADRTTKNTTDSNLKNEALYQAMQSYNQRIYENGQADLADPWDYEEESMNLSAYGIKDSMIGVLSIPKMKVILPVYLGATKEKMAKGAVMLGQTSFPVEGTNSNCVIAAHRGWKGIPMFRDIETLEVGDTVTVQNCKETLTYRVTELKVIMPDDSGYIMIQPGKNMLTLITCHPYRQHTRRYLVYCELTDGSFGMEEHQNVQAGTENTNIKDSEKVRKSAIKEDGKRIEMDTTWRKAGYVLIGVICAGVVAGCLAGRKRNRKNNRI